MKETPHTFAGNPLDRAAPKVKDPQWLDAQLNHNSSRFLPFSKLKVRLEETSGDEPELGWVDKNQVSNATSFSFLGVEDDRAHFAANIPPDTVDLDTFTDCRSAALTLSGPNSGIVAQGRAQIAWHESNGFCSQCGATTEPQRGGMIRACTGCKKRYYPRTDPVVIMLISRGDKCLLGQPNGPMAGSGFYTALAGFVDHAESIEEAVRRETFEEAGVRVGQVRYHSSQPWPFPHTLMVGCQADAVTEEINLDPGEMADVRWFERAELAEILNKRQARETERQGLPAKRVPGSIAIAYHLMLSWLNDEPISRF